MGALQFSFVLRHSLHLSKSPVVFLQYLIALAVVESVRTRKGYEAVPLRVKWPNDVYAEDGDDLKKVGGLLVNSSFVQDEFLVVIGKPLDGKGKKWKTASFYSDYGINHLYIYRMWHQRV